MIAIDDYRYDCCWWLSLLTVTVDEECCWRNSQICKFACFFCSESFKNCKCSRFPGFPDFCSVLRCFRLFLGFRSLKKFPIHKDSSKIKWKRWAFLFTEIGDFRHFYYHFTVLSLLFFCLFNGTSNGFRFQLDSTRDCFLSCCELLWWSDFKFIPLILIIIWVLWT